MTEILNYLAAGLTLSPLSSNETDPGIKTLHTLSVCKISPATCWFLIKRLYEIFAHRQNKTFTGAIKTTFDIWHFKHSFASKMSAVIQSEYLFFFVFFYDRPADSCKSTAVPRFYFMLFVIAAGLWDPATAAPLAFRRWSVTPKCCTHPPKQPHISPFELLLGNIKLECRRDNSKLWRRRR